MGKGALEDLVASQTFRMFSVCALVCVLRRCGARNQVGCRKSHFLLLGKFPHPPMTASCNWMPATSALGGVAVSVSEKLRKKG